MRKQLHIRNLGRYMFFNVVWFIGIFCTVSVWYNRELPDLHAKVKDYNSHGSFRGDNSHERLRNLRIQTDLDQLYMSVVM